MAKGRLIWKSLGSSKRFARLGRTLDGLGEFAQTLYPLLVTHADDHGRQEGDAFTVKSRVFPTSPRTEADFDAALQAMVQVHLIERYEVVHGQWVIQIVNYDQGLKRRFRSAFPPPTTQSSLFGTRGAPDAAEREVRLPTPDDVSGLPLSPSEDAVPLYTDSDSDSDSDPIPDTRSDSHALRARFERFWTAYPRKAGKDAAEREWNLLTPDDDLLDAMLRALETQKASREWRKDGGQYVPNPWKWLNHGRWKDVQSQAPGRKTGTSDDWYDECGALHNHECGLDRSRHHLRKQLEADRQSSHGAKHPAATGTRTTARKEAS